ncbi:hypothetical protein NDU88_001095 [Pleurodeles waltl]|uniref:Uncharacterized protein n=1 Tax=Pleurodeles waltl TaxID=8319 RepID=A0AAV7L8I1_PLEWA|nr:hypothetical protein NDU88_001095 [Pleurodeles waltl]
MDGLCREARLLGNMAAPRGCRMQVRDGAEERVPVPLPRRRGLLVDLGSRVDPVLGLPRPGREVEDGGAGTQPDTVEEMTWG